jgi:AraC-like DNA-binding protein
VRYTETLAGPSLRPYVRRLWALEDATPSELRAVERVVPDGCMELIVHLGPPFRRLAGAEPSPTQPRALLAGQLHGALLLQPGRTIDLVAIRFEPWGAAALLGLDPRELADRLPPLDELVGAHAGRLVDALARAGTVAARLAAAHAWCAGYLAGARLPPVGLRVAATAALADPHVSRVDDLAHRTGWGTRRLERAFEEHVGLAPKVLLRVGRIQRALAGLQASAAPSLAALAVDHGFVDQAHLTREFTRLVGVSPARYRAEAHGLEDLLLEPARSDHSARPVSGGPRP